MVVFQPRNTVLAQTLRNAATPPERTLWTYLSRSQIGGFKFSRQIPVGPYVCDFICRREKFVIEIDGDSRAESAGRDLARIFLEQRGYRVIRFTNSDVLQKPEGVVSAILQALACPPPSPPASGRGAKSRTPTR